MSVYFRDSFFFCFFTVYDTMETSLSQPEIQTEKKQTLYYWHLLF